MAQNYILSLLLERVAIRMPSIGILRLERHWAQFSSDQSCVMPPFDELIIAPEDENYDIDIVQYIALQNEVEYDAGFRIWCDYLASEAVDGVLTIETVAMIDIDRLDIIALDPVFAQQLAPETEPIEVMHDGFFDVAQPSSENSTLSDQRFEQHQFENSAFAGHRFESQNQRASANIQTKYAQTQKPQNRYPQPHNSSQMGFMSYSGILLGLLSLLYLGYFFFMR